MTLRPKQPFHAVSMSILRQKAGGLMLLVGLRLCPTLQDLQDIVGLMTSMSLSLPAKVSRRMPAPLEASTEAPASLHGQFKSRLSSKGWRSAAERRLRTRSRDLLSHKRLKPGSPSLRLQEVRLNLAGIPSKCC